MNIKQRNISPWYDIKKGVTSLKKQISWIISILLLTLISGCMMTQVDDEWGIQLSADKVTSSGLTLICKQSGKTIQGSLQTGTYYILEEYVEEKWVPVKLLPSDYPLYWDMSAWSIPSDSSVQWEINWENIYGKLSPGKYRIGKKIMELKKSDKFDEKLYYAEFTIKN